MEKQIEEMAKARNCETCLHCAICQELEEYRDPLGWISTEGDFVCSYYHKASDLAEEIFAEIEMQLNEFNGSWADTVINTQYLIAELKKKYTESEDTE